jgi:two-component system sensor histidine kinase BaeS
MSVVDGLRGPHSLRRGLFAGIALTLAVSTVVMLAVGAILTRRSLDSDARHALDRQVDLIVAQHSTSPLPHGETTLGRFLATEQERLAILTPSQAELLLPEEAARTLRAEGHADGTVDVRGEPFMFAARLGSGDAIVLLRASRNQSEDWHPFFVGLAAAALIGAILAAGVAWLLARAVAEPVARVAEASRRLAEGESPDPLPVEGSTELRKLATAFNELSEELHRAQDAERAFLLTVSHELKTPLTAIRGHAEALADGVVPAERAGEVIEREAHRLERLIRDLLDLARLRRRSFDVALKATDLGEVANEALARHTPRAHDFGVNLVVHVEPGAGAIADSGRALQAVSNLVENAIRCTAVGGTVEIVASPGRLAVVDDGPGIDPEDLDRAFERFYLWERYGVDRPVGSGLGLAIVAELAAAMRGRVTVASTPGHGSEFAIELAPAPVPDRQAYARLTRR